MGSRVLRELTLPLSCNEDSQDRSYCREPTQASLMRIEMLLERNLNGLLCQWTRSRQLLYFSSPIREAKIDSLVRYVRLVSVREGLG